MKIVCNVIMIRFLSEFDHSASPLCDRCDLQALEGVAVLLTQSV